MEIIPIKYIYSILVTACQPYCLSCDGGASYCTSCASTHYLHESLCICKDKKITHS